jgi:AraC family transcriptional regulator
MSDLYFIAPLVSWRNLRLPCDICGMEFSSASTLPNRTTALVNTPACSDNVYGSWDRKTRSLKIIGLLLAQAEKARPVTKTNYIKMVTEPENSSEALSSSCREGYSPIMPASLLSIGVEATSQNLDWRGLQAVRYRDLATNEIHMPALSQHLLILHTKPPAEGNFRYEGIKREIPPPVGSITVMPVGSVVECRWRGTKDAFHIYLDPKLIARVATTSFELDLSRKGIPPFDALSVPELRTAMLAIDAELTTAGVGGPLLIESLANVLAVHLIRHIFGLRRLVVRRNGVLPRRKLTTVVDYIMANLDGSPRLEQMAALVHLSADHFVRQFKAATGLPPHQFLIRRRVERAQQLLCGREEVSLAEVAIRAGFSDQSQLCFHFKRIVGVTPGQFRASKIT